MPDLFFLSLQARGKMRRFVQSSVFKQKAEAQMAKRDGDCHRCGECCKILFRCPFLGSDDEGQPTCKIYQYRFTQCRLFPIYAHDLEEVKSQCGYKFQDADEPVISGIPAAAAE